MPASEPEGRTHPFLFLSRPSILPSPSRGPLSAIDTAQEGPVTARACSGAQAMLPPPRPKAPSACLRKELESFGHAGSGLPPAALDFQPSFGGSHRGAHTTQNLGVYTNWPKFWAPATPPGPFQMPRRGEAGGWRQPLPRCVFFSPCFYSTIPRGVQGEEVGLGPLPELRSCYGCICVFYE